MDGYRNVCVCVCVVRRSVCLTCLFSLSTFLLVRFEVVLDWNDTRIPVMVDWFDNESDPEYNSNAYKVCEDMLYADCAIAVQKLLK